VGANRRTCQGVRLRAAPTGGLAVGRGRPVSAARRPGHESSRCAAGPALGSVRLPESVQEGVQELPFGLAEIEWEYRKERQAAGIRVAKRDGVYRGRQPGTTKDQPDRARELQAKGLSAPKIAPALGVSPRTVFRYLQATES
jgi:hypothetical protein